MVKRLAHNGFFVGSNPTKPIYYLNNIMNNFNQLINKIKWGSKSKKPYIDIPSFSLGKKIIKYLTKSGFISGFEIISPKTTKINNKTVNIHSIKVNNLNHIRKIYIKFYGKDLMDALTDEMFINLLIQENNDIIKYFKNNELIHDLTLYIVSSLTSKKTKLIYWNKELMLKELEWTNKFKFESIRIFLKYNNNQPTIKDLVSCALPNKFFFWTVENMVKAPQSKELRIKNLLKFRSKYIRMRINYIVSTSKGIMSIEDAISLNLGGKVLFKIYS